MLGGSQDEPDTCRICSAPAEPDAPLFHPCKCSGTIRYIHQDCLTTWLSHSKKKTCDVCKYQYSFTKVYDPNMPKEIPFFLFLRKFAEQIFWGCVMVLRAFVVATMWLAFLPYVTVWTWRFYFVMGENIAWWINDRPRPPTPSIFESSFGNITLSASSNKTTNATVTYYPVWRSLSSDIFTGQIIASLIVLAFLGIFLLREWILQNARPGVFEDDEVLENEPILPQVQPEPQPPEQQQAMPIMVEEDPLPPTPGALRPDVAEKVESSSNALLVLGTKEKEESRPGAPSDNQDASEDEDEEDIVINSKRRKERMHSRIEDPRSRDMARRREMNERRARKGKERLLSEPLPSPPPTSESTGDPPLSAFQFTYTVKYPASPPESSRTETHETLLFADIGKADKHSTPTPSSPSSSWSAIETPGSSSVPQRPTLPSSSRPLLDELPIVSITDGDFVVASPRSSSLSSRGTDPLPSPQLTTFKAPEDFQLTEVNIINDGHGTAQAVVPLVQDEIDAYFRDTSGGSDEEEDPAEEEDHHHMVHIEQPALVDRGRPDGARPLIAAANLPAPLQPEENGPVPDPAEDPDAINDDDVDGALEEAIGMRGPLTTVFQNAALMVFVLDTTIGLGIWLPFTIGKTSVLLSLEPIRLLHILHLPIKLIRLATDPIVDICFVIVSYITLPLVSLFKRFRSLSLTPPDVHITEASTQALPPKDTYSINLKSMFNSFIGINKNSSEDSHLSRGIDQAFASPVGQYLEPYFVAFGGWVRTHAVSAKAGWIELATKDGAINRFFAVVLGYLIVVTLVALYLNVLNVGNVRNAGRAIRNAIRQQLIVLKVAVFIIIELVVFPLGCGIMLDLCTLKLFPNTTLMSRVIFFAHAPVTAVFYHWMVGTMFMYQFAVLLAGCRKIIRPGAMWFIKDPQDQNFHPIRDILDRPTLVQLKKLAISALMYSVVVALGMGCLIFCLRLWGRTLLPIRWKLREPLSDVPIDLLVLHLIIPPTIRHFRPRRVVKSLTTWYWKWAARKLRLTSYMFGGRPADEMVSKSVIAKLKSGWLKAPNGSISQEVDVDGSYRRVPALDNIALPRDMSATVKVDKEGNPVDEAGQLLMRSQDAEAEKARRDVKNDYTVVYLPPRFRERVILFVLSLWMLATMLFVTALALPIHLGRAVFWRVLGREVHDGYSIVVGFYLLWGCYIFGKTLDRIDKRRQRSGGDERRGETIVYLFKYFTLQVLHLSWAAFWLGFVIPTLLALVVELYIVHPLRLIINPELTLRIRIVDSWAVGLLFTKLALAVRRRMRPVGAIDRAIKQLRDDGFRKFNVVMATLDIIFPVTLGLLGCLLLPILIVTPLQRLLPNYISPKALFLYVYPGLFVLAGVAKVHEALQDLAVSWAQQIRDSEFLLEMRLKNLETPSSNSSTSEKPDLTRSVSASTGTSPDSSTISINQAAPAGNI